MRYPVSIFAQKPPPIKCVALWYEYFGKYLNNIALQVYIPNFLGLIDSRSNIERLRYLLYGKVGQLLDHSTGEVINELKIQLHNEPEEICHVYDMNAKSWTIMYMYEIPYTYSYLPEPLDVYTELDYYVRSVGLVNHRFIWSSEDQLTKNDFAKIASRDNHNYHGRYTLAPELPSIKNSIREDEYGNELFSDGYFIWGRL